MARPNRKESPVEDQAEAREQMHRPAREEPQRLPRQHQQDQPGIQAEMTPEPVDDDPYYKAAGKLEGKVALITGGDSGIGRAVAICYAKEGADVAIVYLDEHEDAQEAVRRVEHYGRRCVAIAGDVGDEAFCRKAVERVVQELGHLDILVNNAAEQHVTHTLEELDAAQIERTFKTNLFGYLFMAKAAVPHLKPGSAIIHTSSIQAFKPSPQLMDYAATKAAIVSITRSMAEELTPKGIRVNSVAPGPIWTPLIPASFDEEKVERFGSDTPMKRAGQPAEMAPAFVFFASERDSSYCSGEVLLLTGGKVVGGG